MNLFHQLSRRERQIMDVLHEHQECSAQQVMARMPDAPGYSAVRALLARMVDKGVVCFRQEGAKYIYAPAVEAEAVRASAVSRLLKTFFKGSRVTAVKALLDSDDSQLTDRELAELERTIARLKKARGENSD